MTMSLDEASILSLSGDEIMRFMQTQQWTQMGEDKKNQCRESWKDAPQPSARCCARSCQLSNACMYSFRDLYAAYRTATPAADHLEEDQAMELLYALSQKDRNARVARWAAAAGWYTESQTGDDGIEYLAFSPERA